jgi:phospholipase/carboxylesterase/glyoxalase family protein
VSDFVYHFRPPLTLLLLHGTGGDETSLLPLGRELAPGAALLSPRGQVLEEGAARHFRRLGPDTFDEDDLRARGVELANFVITAAATHSFGRERLILVGYSNGANMGANLLLHHPGLFRAALLFRPILVPALPQPPDLTGLPVFLAGGRLEEPVYQEQTARLADLLRQAGAAVSLHWHEADHAPAPEEVQAARQWLVGLDL